MSRGMFGWSYPPGVRGNEYEISGPEKEWEDRLEPQEACEHCGVVPDAEVLFQSHHARGIWWVCPSCDETNDSTPDFDDEPEPDSEAVWERRQQLNRMEP